MSGGTPKHSSPRLTPRAAAKGALVVAVLSLFVLTSNLGALGRSKRKARAFRLRNLQRFSRLALLCLGIRRSVNVQGPAETRNALIISNHVSYLDVLVLVTARPAIFVTSIEVHDSPFIGTICRAAGCVFVERRNLKSLHKEVSEMADLLKDGWDVVLFPEGTTSPGETLLPFRKSLLDSAVNAEVPVLPAYIRYHRVNGAAFDGISRDKVCYYGSHEFGPHLMSLLELRSIEVEVTFLPSIGPIGTGHRRELADSARQKILQVFAPIVKT